MAFTTAQKKRLVDGDGLTDRTLYVALGIGTTELSGRGYSRGSSPAAMNSSNASGVVTIASGQEIYTCDNPSGGQDSTHMRIYTTAARPTDQGGFGSITDRDDAEAVTDWVPHNDIAAPVDGQRVNTGLITITP